MTGYSIQATAKKVGLTAAAIRFYSEQGVVPGARRRGADDWELNADAVAWLRTLKALRLCGLPLSAVRQALGTSRQPTTALPATVEAAWFRRLVEFGTVARYH